MCVCVCVFTRIYVYTPMYTYNRAHIFSKDLGEVNVCENLFVPILMYFYVNLCPYLFVCVCVCVCVYVRARVYVCECVRAFL